ncbi:malto-oligosyltrehalose trehalohydrolase [Planosporangium flavigriseum]|uniref:Malto-oligosyltrehalose trehalohydrolase n=1 Tax=Planosporangium flavigriseum TaxID=373681 RepID=A0A8J3LVP4_9ACTN|nr:malto-oligosyltrehalose trehalohydrolase [Planosporangium flavigriseum]NJC66435.1 malto-oligosyltrehalose trehalohydrolase [Planosporangium flavigriseum]GIG74155.1 malto-oligosyltrehalose trehalohydrolase [Planosporangium flavigriseum]
MTEFRVWAPQASRVRLRACGGDHDMRAEGRGWWRAEVAGAGPGTDFAYLLDDADEPLPDPRSAWQPAGVHGPSRLYDHGAFGWTDADWTGRALPGSVLYELHIGTFTPEGTFDAAIDRLDHLVELGVDLVELLPVNAFNGEHNWGYDGVCWYAPHEPYGGPDGLKRFVDACHARGLGVIIDAVYNHFGPSGAYAPMFGPYLGAGANTWGASLNLDGPDSEEVRRYIIDSALMWLRDYHADGLRLDAVHALVDHGAVHLLEQLAIEVESLATHLGRPLTLIAESDLNDPQIVTPREAGGHGLHAQWDDDVHHALHALLTGERQGYYSDFGSLECLETVLEGAFFHAGTWSSFRGRRHGRPVDRSRLPGHRFVAYLQNHDQIGNRAQGDRLPATVSSGLLRIGATLLMTGPFTPMLFMGEEWSAGTPWQFFTSHPEPDLAAAVAGGRRREFAEHGWPAGDVPDPQAPETFRDSKLDWSELDKPAHAEMLDLYRRLITLRKAVPDLSDPWLDRVKVAHGDQFVTVQRGSCVVVANLAGDRQRISLPGRAATVLLATEAGVTLSSSAVELPGESAAVIRLNG